MLEKCRLILKISRPKFWPYLWGTYLLGFVIASSTAYDFVSAQFISFFLFFILPANIFLYGINDIFDEETDALNPKKDGMEARVEKSRRKFVQIAVTISLLIGVILNIVFYSPVILALSIIFFFFSTFYSAPPLRFKAKPILDFRSNFLYAIPAIIGYYQLSGKVPELEILFAAFCWTGAMHLFSAIPDIKFDAQARIKTSAVAFGRNKSLVICAVLWSIFSTIIISSGFWHQYSIVLVIYPLIPLILLFDKGRLDINKVYWYFPIINALLGFIVTFTKMIRLPF